MTNRDAWVYNYDQQALTNNVKRTINFYNSEVKRWQKRKQVKIKGLEQGNLQVQEMKHPKKDKNYDLSTIIYNDDIIISAIPEEAYRYEVAGRSAVWWIMNRYQVKTDNKSGIINDPNKWSDDPRYIIDLLARVVTVSIESVKLIDELANIKKAA